MIDAVIEKPSDGASIFGLFLEGAKWNSDKMILDESDSKILFTKCPHILLLPCHFKEIKLY